MYFDFNELSNFSLSFLATSNFVHSFDGNRYNISPLTMLFSKLLASALLFKLGSAAPLPETDLQKRDMVTVTGSTVEIFISNGVTYTFTLSGSATATTSDSTSTTTSTTTTTTTVTASATESYSSSEVATQTSSEDNTSDETTSIDAAETAQPSDGLVHVVNVVARPGAILSQSTFSASIATTYSKTANTFSTTTQAATTSTSASASTSASTSDTSSTAATSSASGDYSDSGDDSLVQIAGEDSDSTTAAASSAASSSAASSSAAASNAATTVSASAASIAASGSSSTTSTATSSDSTSTSSSSDYLTGHPSAIVYSPYTSTDSCKDYDTVYSDLEYILSKGITEVRIYGNDCNYLTTVLPICKILGIKVNQGFWIDDEGVDSIDTAVTDLISAATDSSSGFDWNLFAFITIGNEAINSGYCSVSDLISKISSVKAQLKAAGYTGLVTTSEPPVTFEDYPELCTGSEIDFVGINPHSYFDTSASAATSGDFVKGQIEIVEGICGNLDVYVTETGYPHQGDTNGLNVPSKANQKIALQEIFDVVGTNLTVLTTYDDMWKEPGTYGIEQYFGMADLLADA